REKERSRRGDKERKISLSPRLPVPPSPCLPFSPSVFSGFTFQNHDREIVNGAGFADESGEGFIDAVAQSRGGAPAVLLNDFDQPPPRDLLPLFGEALGHAAEKNHHHAPRFFFDPASAVITERRDTDRKTADVESCHFARSPHQQRRIVPAVDVCQ